MQVSLPSATTQTEMRFVNPCNPEEKADLDHSELQEDRHSPGGRRSRALPPLASLKSFHQIPNPLSTRRHCCGPRQGWDRAGAALRKQKDATAERGERRRRGTRSLFTARAESALRVPTAHIEQGGLRAAERDGYVGRFAATNCFEVGFHMFKHSERWKNYTHSPISPW